MSRPDVLDLYNDCLSVAEETTDDRTAERVLFIAFRLLQMAEVDFAHRGVFELNSAAKDVDCPLREDPATMAWPPGA
jgi:hypothetical protein